LEWADEVCHLYLWTTNNFIHRALHLMETWGFAFKTVLTWVKPEIGLGSYFRNDTEHCLFGVHGKMTTRVKNIGTHFSAPTGEHSEKHARIYEIAEAASYQPRLEVFSRRKREGWETWGLHNASV
jgi:N6-adenosine-specific RNA methylase IME4